MIIYIDEIENSAEKQLNIDFNEVIKDVNPDTPVTGKVVAKIDEAGVKIKGDVEVDIKLECDRCLKDYVEHLNIKIDEIFVKGDVYKADKAEVELKIDTLVNELGNSKEIDLTDLIYQNLTLNVPNKKLCDINCKGSDEYQKLQAEEHLDPRLEIFKEISKKMNK